MATPIPTPNHIIIWLDQYIGLPESNTELKSGVSEQADPEKILPTSPTEKNINESIQFKNNIEQSFDQIPKNLKAFNEKDECLRCIGESLNDNKKVFFITSGSMGKEIARDIITKYPSLQNIYVFCGYYKAHLDWVDECLDHNIICLMYDFHTDLLARVLREVAEYFISEGDKELNQNQQLAYSAISYFNWAKLLLERANKFDTKNIFIRLEYVENRIAFAEKLIENLKGNVDDRESSESHQ
jgi:hypothetical protein